MKKVGATRQSVLLTSLLNVFRGLATQRVSSHQQALWNGSGREQAIKNYEGGRKVKNHWLAWRANQQPLIGETTFSSVPQPSVTSSSSRRSRTLEELFEVVRPLRALDLASCIASIYAEKQGYRQRLAPESCAHKQEQLLQTLIVFLLKIHLFSFRKLRRPILALLSDTLEWTHTRW